MEEAEELCGYFEGYTTQRFVIISVFSLFSFFGVIANALLMAVFRRTLGSSVYLFALSSCDLLICLTYLLLFGVDAGFVYLRNTTLFFLYHRYIVPVFFMAKVVQFAIPFILILITFERYLWTTREKTRQMFAVVFDEKGRNITICVVFVMSVVLRVPVLFATQVKEYPACDDYFRSESVSPTDWAKDSYAYRVFDFQIITAVQMFFPFFVLLILNLVIIKRLIAEKHDYATMNSSGGVLTSSLATKKMSFGPGNLPENYVLLEVAAEVMRESLLHSDSSKRSSLAPAANSRRQSMFQDVVIELKESSRSKRSQLRNAIYTMLAIVTSYLVCNGIHLFLTFLERFESSVLYESDDQSQSSNFYIVLSDMVSIVYMVSSAIRIFIYAKCNPKLRVEISNYLRRRESVSGHS
ncbi:unnamed protein product [Caenorhabditis auriculariae]|uniref:G-protein coupled receptors family 1 profile domain-containing protein n=1 Tax=Caenorhabditis auriculariae TaxID=2777116 RepID=A0A8S1HPW1_9PELO|nr:unnamed protein product [Caenorhabditis auriculariae]